MSKEQKKIKQQKVKVEGYWDKNIEKGRKELQEKLKHEKKLKKSIEGLKELFGSDESFEKWVSQIWEHPKTRSHIVRIGNKEIDTRIFGYTQGQQEMIIRIIIRIVIMIR